MFKDKLKELRLKEKLTQAELAEKIYVSRSAVAKWEQGRGLPTVESLEALSKYFNVSEDELIGKKEPLIMYNKIKIKKDISQYFISAFLFVTLFVFVALVISTVKNKYYSKIDHNLIRDYKTTEIGLALDDTYMFDIEDFLEENNVEYTRCEIVETEYYTVKGNIIKPIKEGVFGIEIKAYNRKNKTYYQTTPLKIYCYDINNMIKINTVEDLININNNLSGHYILNANIDLSLVNNFDPIGGSLSKDSFTGFLINPNDYVIKNLTIKSLNENHTSEYDGCCGGLFENIYSAYIDNLILENVYIDVSECSGFGSTAGAIADTALSSFITNCKVTGTIIANVYVGGLFASCNGTTIINNIFNGDIIQRNNHSKTEKPGAGGIAGYLIGNEDNLADIVANNIINANIKSDYVVGKISGYVLGNSFYDNLVYARLDAPEKYEIGKNPHK